MLTYRLTNCEECTSIPKLIEDIDCKLTELGKREYNNVSYALNKHVDTVLAFNLLNYRRILQFKSCNEEYANLYSVKDIASRIKLLKFK